MLRTSVEGFFYSNPDFLMSIHAIPDVENAICCTGVSGEASPLGPLCPGGYGPRLPVRPSDEVVLQHLGAAVMLCWAELPLGVRDRILRQADDVIGLAPIPQVRNEIVKLMLRRAKVQWTASLL
jgi:hypothetical protein